MYLFDVEHKPKQQAPKKPELSLYDHQQLCLDKCRQAFLEGHKRILLCLPTGGGKSEIAAKMLSETTSKGGNRGMLSVYRRTLVSQFSQRLSKYNIPHGVIMAQEVPDRSKAIQVSSISTIFSRYIKDAENSIIPLPEFKLFVYDEAHTQAKQAAALFDRFPNAYVIGLSATPADTNGGGLGGYGYTKIVYGPTVRWLMDNGYLVDARYFAPEEYDYTGVTINSKTGEYVESSADDIVDRPELIGGIIDNYKMYGEGKRFVTFANSVAHSRHIEDQFNLAGIPCKHIDCYIKDEERQRAYRDIKEGRILGLTNYGILDRGFDVPEIEVCILARKIRNVTTYKQMIGRVLRNAPGKTEAIVIDHGGNVAAHGLADREVKWTLDPKVNQNKRDRDQKKPPQTKCPKCKAVFPKSKVCPKCKYEIKPPETPSKDSMEHKEGFLVEVTKDGAKGKSKAFTEEQKVEWWKGFAFHAERKGFSTGWAAYAYKRKFGDWPEKHVKSHSPSTPTPEVESYIRYLQLRYIKGKQRGK